MQASDLEVIRDIPGFQMIMKVILKNQIQRMVEQLAEYTGEESVILTASVSDGSLSHLGTESGKAFLEVHDGIKPQFLGFCLKMHHQQEKLDRTNKQEYLDSGGDLRQKFGPGSTHHGTRPYTVSDVQAQSPAFGKSSLKVSHSSTSKSMRHDPYPVSLPKHPTMHQSVMKERRDLVTNQTMNNVPTDAGSQMEKDMDDPFTANIQEAMKFTGNIEEAMRIKMEAEDNETESDDYSETGDDQHPSSQYSGQYSVGQFEIQEHQTAESDSEKSATVTNDDPDSRPNDSELAPDDPTPEADVSNGSRASSDKDSSNFPPAFNDRQIKVEVPSESEMEQQDSRAASGVKMPPASGNMPSASGTMPSASANMPSASGNIPTASGNIPTAGGNMPSASGDWMMNLHEMIGSIAAASGATSLGETTQESSRQRNKSMILPFSPSEAEAMLLPYSPPVALMKGLGCRYCHKVCSDKTKLTIHERIHTGEKPYSCEICGKGCTTKSNLKSHMRVHGEKEFPCEICGKNFMSKSNLKSHLQTHLKELKNLNRNEKPE